MTPHVQVVERGAEVRQLREILRSEVGRPVAEPCPFDADAGEYVDGQRTHDGLLDGVRSRTDGGDPVPPHDAGGGRPHRVDEFAGEFGAAYEDGPPVDRYPVDGETG